MSDHHSAQFVSVLLLVLALGSVSTAGASLCALDQVPAATVLVPYFEVDLNDPEGVTTFVHLHNAESEATLVKVTFWTDWSVPTVSFDVFLTGYDVVRLDLRDVFAGNIPITADAQSDPGDGTSPHGSNPEWDDSFSGCESVFPFLTNPAITGNNLARLVGGHTGQPVTVGAEDLCLGSDQGDGIARGYLTLDDTRRCTFDFPSEPGYFGGVDPVATDHNQLWGEVWLLWPEQGRRASLPAVHLESAAPDVEIGSNTFYQRYSGGADRRERLPTRWGTSAFDNAAVSDDWIVWRDGGSTETLGFDCGVGSVPLSMNGASCFDQQESLAAVCQDQTCLPLDTQKLDASSISPHGGWCDVDLSSVGIPGRDPSQSWVGVIRRGSSGDAGANHSVVLDGDCITSIPPLFVDGFETGDASMWSATVGGAS